MACEKYANRLVDAALGKPQRRRDATLLAHLSACASCAEEFRRAQWLRSSIDRGVETVVSGDPSPQFVAQIRSQIAAVPAPARAIVAVWAPAGVVAAALAVLLASSVLRGPQEDNDRSTIVANPTNPPAAIVHASARPATLPPRPTLVHSKRPARSPEPEVLVPPGQLALALQLSQGLVSGRTNGEALFAAQKEFEKPFETGSAGAVPSEAPAGISPADSGGFERIVALRRL